MFKNKFSYSKLIFILSFFIFLLVAQTKFSQANINTQSQDHLKLVLAELGFLIIFAKLLGSYFKKINLPSVLAELLVGFILGNYTTLLGLDIDIFSSVKSDEFIKIISDIGVIILMFEVGVNTDINKLIKVGFNSIIIALLGVILPIVGVFLIAKLFQLNLFTSALLGVALAPTSVGIAARFLKDYNLLGTNISQLILGSAIADDIISLILLVSTISIITANSSIFETVLLTIKSLILLTLAALSSHIILKYVFEKITDRSLIFIISLSTCFIFAYLALALKLASIIGSFAAGLVISKEKMKTINTAIEPIDELFVPIFFVLMGMFINIKALLNIKIIFLSIVLILIAYFSKILSNIILPKRFSKIFIGIARAPRGEVTLIAATLGLNYHIFTNKIYSAILCVVLVTTLLTPLLLRYLINKVKLS